MKYRESSLRQHMELDDQNLLIEIDRLKKDVENTEKWMKELEAEKETIEYINKKVARLAFGFAREKYEILAKEAQRRGLLS